MSILHTRPPSERHEHPASEALERKMEGFTETRSTTLHLPADLDGKIRLHAATQETSYRDVYRTVIDAWVRAHLEGVEDLHSVSLKITALEDRRKGKVERGGEDRIVTLSLSRDSHKKLKQISMVQRLTLRGIIAGIMQEWANDALS